MLSVQPSTDLYGGNNSPSLAPWQTGVPAAAVGSIPAPTSAQITAGPAVGTAIGLGKQVYSQLPGYSTDIAGIGANVGSEIQGKLPQDVIDQLTNEAAARGVANGTGAGAMNLDLLKTLGLNSLQLTQMGQQGLNTQLGQLPGAALYQNPNFYPGSAETLAAEQQNNLNAAAPNPTAAATAALHAAGSGYGVGSAGVATLPGPTTSGAFPSVLASGSNLATLNQLAQTYNPSGTSNLVTGDMYGGGPGDNMTGAGASETALSPDTEDSLYLGSNDYSGEDYSD